LADATSLSIWDAIKLAIPSKLDTVELMLPDTKSDSTLNISLEP
jgi:hypothetical protein